MNSFSASGTQHSSTNAPVRFYLVDDDELFHLIHNRFIKSQLPNVEIINFIDPREALKEITTQPASSPSAVLLLDLNMPYLTGWEWLDAFIAQEKTPPSWLKIFILSSSDSYLDRNRALQYPFINDYLIKPLTKVSIEKIMQQAP